MCLNLLCPDKFISKARTNEFSDGVSAYQARKSARSRIKSNLSTHWKTHVQGEKCTAERG